ncbi:MAG: tRNA 4-thiouridine(8) synthase ThiI [Clostridiales Family XIII bacterium]|jgi:thiamine biosynthesis protein ThiI|nr:tRNA 4-thiouridine(8) synthase ThiI [Clostridiales Family XIII bacterium]
MTDKKEILIVRYGEISLKGMNKPYFEKTLQRRIGRALAGIPGVSVRRDAGLIVVAGERERLPALADELIRRLTRVFGIYSISPAVRLGGTELGDVYEAASELMRQRLAERAERPLTFKVFGKRSDKRYPVTSPEIAALTGEAVIEAFGGEVKADMTNPAVSLNVHLRVGEVFIFDEKVSCHGGMPIGTNGKGMVLLSGGIDSPVALWLMAKRGMSVEVVHYHSYPYTSGRAKEKVEELARILAGYTGTFTMHEINLLPAQEAIAAHCPDHLMTILVRRFMMKIAERLALGAKCNMLVTGESLGQVASQTAESIYVTDRAVTLPVMRPLIAMDKTDIMDLAREIGTYEKSIEPFEDCCTVFLPRHPATKPTLAEVEAAEAGIPDIEELIAARIAEEETVVIRA